MRAWIIATMAAAALVSSPAFTQQPSRAASIPDFSGIWGNLYLYGIEPPVSGPGPVVNKARRRQTLDVDGRPLSAADAPLVSAATQPALLKLLRTLPPGLPLLTLTSETTTRSNLRLPSRSNFSVDSFVLVLTLEAGAIAAIDRLEQLDRRAVRVQFERRFSARRMAEDYLRCYAEATSAQTRRAG